MDDTKKLIEKYKRELMELSRSSRKPAASSATPATPAPPAEPAPKKAPRIIGYVGEESGEIPAAYDKFLSEIIGSSGNNDDKCSDEPQSEPEDMPDFFEEEQPDDEILDASEEIFGAPRYTGIPSTEQVREEITEQSDPSENYPEENVSGVTDNTATTPRADLADVQSVSEEQAERLNDMPISGTDKDEQLTGRSFEDESIPGNSSDNMERNGSRAAPIDYPETVYDNFDDFTKKNVGRGTILFRVYTAREAVPIEGAKCVISKKIKGNVHKIDTLVTDNSGQTRTRTLPAPSKELSQHSENEVQPFALYDATVTKDGFAEVVLYDIPVFDGVQSIQRVSMIPVGNGEIAEEITEVPDAER